MSLELQRSPDDLRDAFLAMRHPRDLADLLEVGPRTLTYHLYVAHPEERYASFSIRKRTGGVRQILAPVSALKILQRKLASVLDTVYQPHAPVHGFRHGRSIVTNARQHTNRRFVLNVDLTDFFPSVNFGRVRGLFMAPPYSLPSSVATVLAQLCCFNNQLPQGAPTSPVVSNMICSRMDSQLRQLAESNRATYTRYADDMTFSTAIRLFPHDLATFATDGTVQLGEKLMAIILANGFLPNMSKLRCQSRHRRQEVTGLTTNVYPNVGRRYVRQVRAMLHDWRTKGNDAAALRHERFTTTPLRSPTRPPPVFSKVVKGKIDFISMVKGKDDPNYRKFLYEYARLNPAFVLRPEVMAPPSPGKMQALLFTGGKTDWRHLKAALCALQSGGSFPRLDLRFREEDDDIGDDKLLDICDAYSRSPDALPVPYCFIFDRDNDEILKKAKLKRTGVRDWGKNVFAIALPVPSHRPPETKVCVELLYRDDDLMRPDAAGRRLFLSNEFFPESGRHRTLDLNYALPRKLNPDKLAIIDSDVFDSANRNVALPKAKFADYVLAQAPGYSEMGFIGFAPLLEVCEDILFGANPNEDIPGPRPTHR